jgi:hypothetical protein
MSREMASGPLGFESWWLRKVSSQQPSHVSGGDSCKISAIAESKERAFRTLRHVKRPLQQTDETDTRKFVACAKASTDSAAQMPALHFLCSPHSRVVQR